MAEIYQLPDSNGGNNGTNIPFSIPIGLGGMNNGFGFGSSSTSTDYLKETLKEDGNENNEEVYAIPSNGNKAE